MERLTRNRNGSCVLCGGRATYFAKHDLFGCVKCDVWLEEACSCSPHDNCPFEKPPERPSDVKT